MGTLAVHLQAISQLRKPLELCQTLEALKRPSTTSPVKIENLAFCPCTACNIDCASDEGVSHPRLPIAPAATSMGPVSSA